MKSTTKIDWFTGVCRYAKTHPIPLSQDMAIFVPCNGWSGYDMGERELDTGIKRYSSTTREDMGFAVVASASALDNLAAIHADNDMLGAMWRWGFREYRSSRIDLAIDLYDGGEHAQRVARAAKRGVIKTKARSISVIEEVLGNNGLTTYIGRRASTRFMRIYDKDAESKGRVPTSRFELQANARYAEALWKDIHSPDQSVLNAVAYAAVNGLVSDWGDEQVNFEMKFILVSNPAPKPEPTDNAWVWISKQVLPTILRDYYSNEEGHETILEKLNKAVIKD